MRLALAGVVLLSACFTPVPEQCKSKRCLADGGNTSCSVGSTRECGSAIGICKVGRQTCGTDGTWGRCSGGTEPGVEVCDGKDNNCDGVVDEGVGRMCPLQKGVCAGASGACGGDAGCQQAYGAQYELLERRCDGLDNDCDGVVDRTGPINVSQSPGVISRKPVAVKAPGDEAVIILYEEGSKVAARVLRADGTISEAVAPSVTVEASTRSWAPAIAVSGQLVVAAWAEEIGATKRIMVASLDPASGRSDLTGNGALLALTATNPTEVTIGVDQAASRLLLAVVDTIGLRLAGFTAALPPPMGTPSFTAEPYDFVGQRPSIAPAGGGSFWLSHDLRTTGNLWRALIKPTGPGPFDNSATQGHNASLFTADGGAESFFLAGSAASKTIMRSRCTEGPTNLSCTMGTALTAAAEIDGLRVDPAGVVAWQRGVAAPRVVVGSIDRPDAGIEIGPGRRPLPLAASNQIVVVFDTESVVSTLVSSDEIYFVRTCR